MSKYRVCSTSEIGLGERILIEIEGKEIGIFNINGDYKAYINWCPHQSGPCAEGSLTGTKYAEYDSESLSLKVEWRENGEILNCPWHGWEFDIKNGECLSRETVALPSFSVHIENDVIFVEL